AARSWYAQADSDGRTASEVTRATDVNNEAVVAVLQDSLVQAERLFRQAVELADRAHAPDSAWPPQLGLGEIAERRGDFDLALEHDRRAATLIDTLRARQDGAPRSVALYSERLFAIEALIHLLC